MKIFIINLDRDRVRRKLMADQLSKLNLNYDFISAINPNSEIADDLEFPFSQPEAERILCRALSLGELGCALSHFSIYRKMQREDIGEALIMEDDAKLDSRLPEILRHLAKILNWEMVLLGHWSLNRNSMSAGAELSFLGQNEFLERKIGKAAEFPLGAYAYVIRKSAANKLLNYFCPVRMPADYVTGGAEKASIDLKLISPPVVTHQGLDSTIGQRQESGAAKAEFQLVKKIKKGVRKVLLFLRKVGIFRKSYIWIFNRQFG